MDIEGIEAVTDILVEGAGLLHEQKKMVLRILERFSCGHDIVGSEYHNPKYREECAASEAICSIHDSTDGFPEALDKAFAQGTRDYGDELKKAKARIKELEALLQ